MGKEAALSSFWNQNGRQTLARKHSKKRTDKGDDQMKQEDQNLILDKAKRKVKSFHFIVHSTDSIIK